MFFLTWVFSKSLDLPYYSYILAIAICSILSTVAVYYVAKWFYFQYFNSVETLKIKLSELISFLGEVRVNYIFNLAHKATNNKNKEEIKIKVDEFDEDLINTLKKTSE